MESLAAAAATAEPLSPPHVSLFARLTMEERLSCVTLHKVNWSDTDIADHLHVHRNTVRAVLARYTATGDVCSGKRKGRPRCTDEATDTAIAFTARVDVFTSPRQVRRKLELGDGISISTIDRRLQEGLFRRVARHKREYTEVEIRKQ